MSRRPSHPLNRISQVGLILCVVAGLTWTMAGCETSSVASSQPALDPETVAAHQTAFTLSEEPDGVKGISQILEELLGELIDSDDAATTDEYVDVIVLGKTGVGWEEGKSAFVMSDPSAVPVHEDHGEAGEDGESAEHAAHGGEGHDPDDCPFCAAAAAAAPKAVVRFTGDNDELIGVDSRELFSLADDEIVIVKGKGRVIVGQLYVNAEKIYVRR